MQRAAAALRGEPDRRAPAVSGASAAPAAAVRLPLTELPAALPVAVYQLNFTACSPGSLPAASGSAWRGALGRQLRSAVCTTPALDCADCLLRRRCAFSLCFRPALSAGRSGRFAAQHATPPFALYPEMGPRRLAAGDPAALELTLIGRQGALLPALLGALAKPRLDTGAGSALALQLDSAAVLLRAGDREGQTVWERGRWRDAPDRTDLQPPDWLLQQERLGIRFLSPVRIKHRGRMLDRAICAEVFLINLLRRLSLLSECWLQRELDVDGDQIAALGQSLREPPSESPAPMRRWQGSRYSKAQQRSMPIDGLLGELVIDTAPIAHLLPLVWLGQWLHIGKGSSFGQGRYQVFVLNP